MVLCHILSISHGNMRLTDPSGKGTYAENGHGKEHSVDIPTGCRVGSAAPTSCSSRVTAFSLCCCYYNSTFKEG